MQNLAKYELTHFTKLINKYDTFFFDMNGVLWHGPDLYPKSFEMLNHLQQLKKNIFFITNGSNKSRTEYVEKLSKNGYKTDIDHIYAVSYFAPAVIKKQYPEVKKLYIIGEFGFVDEARELGFEVISGLDHVDSRVISEEKFNDIEVDENIKAVIVGEDLSFNFFKLSFASICIEQNNAHFFAANDDPRDYNGKRNIPSCGSLVKALETTTAKEAIVLGKPNKYALDYIIEKYNFDRSKCLMTGDRINADVAMAINAGLDSCLLLSGETKPEKYEFEVEKNGGKTPTYICERLSL